MLLPLEVAAVLQEVRVEPVCHNDPRLLRRAQSYARLLSQTTKIGLTALARRPACAHGVFIVQKKENCHKTRALFAPLPSVELFSGDGLSRIEVNSSGLAHRESPGLHDGCAVVADFFHRMRLSGNNRPFFLLARVSNKYLKMTEIEGIQVWPNQTIWPMCCSLPVGFSWSLYFAHSANRARLNQQPSLRHSVEMTDLGPTLVLSLGGQNAQTGHHLHVDNIGVVSD